MENVFIARQPIYNLDLEVIGYELLYRDNTDNQANVTDGNLASSRVIVNAFMNIGVDSMVGSAKAFINLTDLFLSSDNLTPMFENQCVLEVLEHVPVNDEVLAGIRRLKKKGYQIALDDFAFEAERMPFLELADYVKIDVLQTNETVLTDYMQKLSDYEAIPVAEKVETHEMFALCKQLGFKMFQGYFFCKPKMVNKKTLSSNKAVVLSLINELEQPGKSIAEVSTVLSQDVALSYKLLRYINSAAFALRKEVDSIESALMLVGVETIKNWTYMIMMSRMVGDKPQELIVVALTRAKMCELLGKDKPHLDTSKLFVMGLFSNLDALFDMPMVEVLDEISIPGEIKLALLDHQGDYGELLSQVIDYERGQWQGLISQHADASLYAGAYLQAMEWADTIQTEL